MCFILDQLLDTTETIGEKTSWRQAFDRGTGGNMER